MRSTPAVTTGRRECLMAARPAASSQSFITVSPCTNPAVLASPTPIQRTSWDWESAAARSCTGPTVNALPGLGPLGSLASPIDVEEHAT